MLKNPSTAYLSLRYNLSITISPASGYEYIHNHYESLNEYYTVADTSSSFTTSIANNNRAVQSVNTVDLLINLGTASLSQWHTVIFKINNALPGIIPFISSPNDTTNYDYKYFKVLNMIIAQKKNSNNVLHVGIGSSSSAVDYQSTFGISWVRIFNSYNAPTNVNPYTLLYSTPPTLTLTHLTSYSSKSITLVEGY